MTYEETKEERSLALSNEERKQVLQQQSDYRYDPEHTLHKVGFLQERMVDAVMGMNVEELLYKPKIMENVNALLNNMNGTAVQVKRNSIVESNSNLGILADSVIDRMEERGLKLIKIADPNDHASRRGTIPEPIDIDDAEFEEIQPQMLVKGLIHTTYDDFAEQNDLQVANDEL